MVNGCKTLKFDVSVIRACPFKGMVLGRGSRDAPLSHTTSDFQHSGFKFHAPGSESYDLSIKSEDRGARLCKSSHLAGVEGRAGFEKKGEGGCVSLTGE